MGPSGSRTYPPLSTAQEDRFHGRLMRINASLKEEEEEQQQEKEQSCPALGKHTPCLCLMPYLWQSVTRRLRRPITRRPLRCAGAGLDAKISTHPRTIRWAPLLLHAMFASGRPRCEDSPPPSTPSCPRPFWPAQLVAVLVVLVRAPGRPGPAVAATAAAAATYYQRAAQPRSYGGGSNV